LVLNGLQVDLGGVAAVVANIPKHQPGLAFLCSFDVLVQLAGSLPFIVVVTGADTMAYYLAAIVARTATRKVESASPSLRPGATAIQGLNAHCKANVSFS
jgi:hypothetical protein